MVNLHKITENSGRSMELNSPNNKFKIKETEKGRVIFDCLRMKYVPLTPEEGVRQWFVRYLIDELKYPQALMNNEIGIVQNGIKRRCDTVVFDRAGSPLMIVEYKAPEVKITQKVFDQIYRYNTVLRAGYLVVSNGGACYCAKIDYEKGTYAFLKSVPPYEAL